MDKLFRIFEITKELAEDIASRTIDAHFHDFEELIIVKTIKIFSTFIG